ARKVGKNHPIALRKVLHVAPVVAPSARARPPPVNHDQRRTTPRLMIVKPKASGRDEPAGRFLGKCHNSSVIAIESAPHCGPAMAPDAGRVMLLHAPLRVIHLAPAPSVLDLETRRRA